MKQKNETGLLKNMFKLVQTLPAANAPFTSVPPCACFASSFFSAAHAFLSARDSWKI